jgi:hypothetical protein
VIELTTETVTAVCAAVNSNPELWREAERQVVALGFHPKDVSAREAVLYWLAWMSVGATLGEAKEGT